MSFLSKHIIHRIQNLEQLLKSRRWCEMQKLDAEIWQQLALYRALIGKVINFPESDIIFRYLNIRAIMYLKCGNLNACNQMNSLFERLSYGKRNLSSIAEQHCLIIADVEFRMGHVEVVKEMLDRLIRKTSSKETKAYALKKLEITDISEGNKFFPYLGIDKLSEALGLAENCDNQLLVAQIHTSLSQSFQHSHPALGLSLLWKARIIYEKQNMRKYAINCKLCKLTMADIYISMTMKYTGLIKDDEVQSFHQAALEILDELSFQGFDNDIYRRHDW